MPKVCALRTALWLPLLMVFSHRALPAQVAAVVVQLQGKCLVRRASDASRKPQPITKTGQKVFVEDLVRCGPGASLTLDFGYAKKPLGPSQEEYPVPLAPSQPLTREQKLIAEAIRDYGTRGGRSRSMGGVLYSPPADGAALAGSFVVRWIPWQPAKQVLLTIETDSHGEVFRQDQIDARAGQFTSEPLRAALVGLESTGKLRLSIFADASTTPRDQVEFRLLSAEEQQSLEKDLHGADQDEFPLMRHIVRAYAFWRRQLWAEAALEYEAAIADTPTNRDLLERAARAESETGNLSRQAQFEEQLRKLGSAP
jgi:hypothetical protein